MTADRRFELAGYVRNALNETYYQAHFYAPLFGGLAAGNDASSGFQGLKRSYGAEVVVRF